MNVFRHATKPGETAHNAIGDLITQDGIHRKERPQ